MTYPQYQPPQQGYAGLGQPAYGAPQPPQQQQYAQPYPQQQPAMGQAVAPPMPQLRDGGATGGSVSPKLRHLLGRTVIVEPISIGKAKNMETGELADEARFNLTVVDGGPFQYGDSQSKDPAKQRPNTHEIDTPCRFANMSDMGFGFVQAVREMLDSGEHGRVSVVQRGTKGNFPYLLTKTGVDVLGAERPDGQARFDAAMQLFGKIWADKHAPAGAPRQFVSPEPRSLVAPPLPAGAQHGYGAPQVNYGTPPQAATGYPQPPQSTLPQAYGYDPQYAAQQYVPQNTPPAPPAYGGIPQQGQLPGGFYGVGAPASAPPAQPAPQLAPPGVEAYFATLPPDQAAAARAQYFAQQTAGAPAGPGI